MSDPYPNSHTGASAGREASVSSSEASSSSSERTARPGMARARSRNDPSCKELRDISCRAMLAPCGAGVSQSEAVMPLSLNQSPDKSPLAMPRLGARGFARLLRLQQTNFALKPSHSVFKQRRFRDVERLV